MSVQYWGTPDALSAEQVVHYLERLGLDAQATLARPADYALLAEVQLAQVLRVPFDTSSIHLPLDPSDKVAMAKPFAAMGGYGMAMDVQSTYENVVERGRGGYCFAVNMLLAALFRALGFRVSAVASRGYRRGHQDPGKGGYIWGPIVHCCLLVDTIDQGRFLSDVGFFTGASSMPVPWKHGAVVTSLTATETFELRHEPLPGVDLHHYPDTESNWTLYRRFAYPKDGNNHTAPLYSIIAQSLAPADIEVLSFFASRAPSAPFTKQLIVARHNADGSRDTLNWLVGEPCAKLYTREGVLGKIIRMEDVPLTNAALYDACKRRFGF